MPEPVSAAIGAVTTLGGAALQSSAAKRGGRAQTRAADASIAEQRRQFDAVRALLNPYVQAGSPALQGLMGIAGIGEGMPDWNGYLQANPDVAQEFSRIQGEGRFSTPQEFAEWHYNNFGKNEGRTVPVGQGQDAAFRAIEQSPGFQALARQGEEAILQNASATGGLRGGNTQGALARFRPALLDQFIERQFGRLGNIASIGQNAAAGVGNAGMTTGANIGNTLMAQGQAQAGAIGAQGQIWGSALGQLGGMGANLFGGGMIRSPNASLLPSVNNAFAQNPRIF